MKHSQIQTSWSGLIQACRKFPVLRTVASAVGAIPHGCLVLLAVVILSTQAQAQTNNAAFVSQNVPSTMTAGQSYTVSITMQNTGTTTWSASTNYKLGSQNPIDNTLWRDGRVLLNSPVSPGQQYTFTFPITAPATAGTYNFQWKMLREAVEWFGALSPNVAVTVSPPPPVDGAAFVSQSVSSAMTAGGSYNVSVTMRNTGNTTWTASGGYKLGSQNPQDNYIWMAGNRVELGYVVAPGQQYTFNFTVTAPSTAGVYNFQWRMVREYVTWFGSLSTNVAVTVAVPPPLPTISVVRTPSTMVAGEPYTVQWTTTNATSVTYDCTASGTGYVSRATVAANGQLSGTASVAWVGYPSTCTWTATGSGGSRNLVETMTTAAALNNAQYITQNVPLSMTAGQSYSVSVTMRNSGNTTWTAAKEYKLGSQNPENNATWNSGRVTLGTSVAPGQQYTFSFSIIAPTTAGTYNFQWRMLREYVEWFGATSTNQAVAVSSPTPAPTLAVQRTPSPMTAGQPFSLTWSSTSATSVSYSCTASGTGFTGSATLAPSGTTTGTASAAWVGYPSTCTWTATGAGGTRTFSETMTTVTPQPTVSPPPKTQTRTVAYEYDSASGLQTRQTLEPGSTQLRLDIANGYDAWGNKISVTESSPAAGIAAIASRTTSTPFDANGRFQTSETNAEGHTESRAHDPRHGQVTSLTDVQNGLTTQWEYDAFGRKTLEIAADGGKTRWDYTYCSGVNGGAASCPAHAKYVVQVTRLAADGVTPNGPWTKAYFDALDREVQSETLGFDGVSVATITTDYDNLGRTTRISRPYFRGQLAQWSSAQHDVLDRVTSTTVPETTVTYNGLSSTVTNALGQRLTRVTDSQGQLVGVIDAALNAMTYQYDAFGNLWKTTDVNGNTVLFAFDIRGNKTQMWDPDLGSWLYDHDAAGNLVRQTDAKQQVTTRTYDKLNRMRTQSEPDLVSSWTYDSCTKGVGRLCQVTASNGYAQTSTYDTYGRATGISTTIDTVYNQSVAFDANGRLATSTYPSGLVLNYIYTPLGYLKEVRNSATSALYWRADSLDAAGSLLQQTYGNNVVTQQVFDASTGRLRNIHAGTGNGVQNLSFNYDGAGNLLSRNDANQGLSETFVYDDRNRLTSSTVSSSGAGTITQTYSYDSIGNLRSRTGVGTYTYGVVNNRPHGVASIDWTGVGQRRFTYDLNGNLIDETQLDANGNVVANKGRTASYTSFNMPRTLATPGNSLTFVYDAEHKRIKEIASNVTTIYIHPDNHGGLSYEKDVRSDGTVEHRNFITAHGQVVAVVKQTGATTSVRYLHRDYQGSTTAVTNESGTVVERLSYEPFGKRRFPNGATDANHTVVGSNTNRGYTNHEHLDALGLIHMNGRVYNPLVARFMTADPGVPHPEDPQSFNRYSYTRNNPLAYDDPSGFDDAASGQGATSSLSVADLQVAFDEVTIVGKRSGFKPDPGSSLEKIITGYSYNGTPVIIHIAPRPQKQRVFFPTLVGMDLFEGLDPLPPVLRGMGLSSGQAEVAALGVGMVGPKSAGKLAQSLGRGLIKISRSRWQHVIDRHTINSIVRWVNKSKFIRGVDLKALAVQAEKHAPVASGGNFARVFDAGYVVGVDRTTKTMTSWVTVITDASENLITMHPGLPTP
jgi:RHS repeat-associated protein